MPWPWHVAAETPAAFPNHLFVKFNMRLIYIETAAPYYAQFRSGAGRFFEVEGHFRNRVIINGRPEDLYVLTFSREPTESSTSRSRALSLGPVCRSSMSPVRRRTTSWTHFTPAR